MKLRVSRVAESRVANVAESSRAETRIGRVAGVAETSVAASAKSD